jgi:uncharacterized protein
MSEVEVRDAVDGEVQRELKLVDCDVHAQPTPAMLSRYLSPRWARHLERYGRRAPMVTEWYPRARNGGMRIDAWPDKPGHIWGSDPEFLRDQLLDEWKIDYAILEVLSGQDCYDAAPFAAEWNHAINQWLVDEWLDFDARLLGAIVVPHEYPDIAVAEIERMAGDERFVQVLLPSSAQEQLGARKYWPIYEAAAAHGLPVAFHTGGYWDHRGPGRPSYYLEYHVANGIVMQTQLTSMVANGLFAAIPEVKVVLTECGLAWAAALRWSLDAAWELTRDDMSELERAPSEYIHDHVWFTTQPIEEPDDAAQLLRVIGHAQLEDRLLFATDYPHWDFDSPAQALPRAMPRELRQAIRAGNAAQLYGLPLAQPGASS